MAQADYTRDSSKDESIDMFGFIYTPYDNGQYRVTTQAFKAWNLIGYGMGNIVDGYVNERITKLIKPY